MPAAAGAAETDAESFILITGLETLTIIMVLFAFCLVLVKIFLPGLWGKFF
jgi:hypothetical protein